MKNTRKISTQSVANARKRLIKKAMWNAVKAFGVVGFLMVFSALFLPPNQEPFSEMRAWVELNRIALAAAGALIAAVPVLAMFLHNQVDE